MTLRWHTLEAGTKLFRGMAPSLHAFKPSPFLFATDFATAFRGYARSDPRLMRVVEVKNPLKLFIMDRPNMAAIKLQVAKGKLPSILLEAMEQVTGYGIVKSEYKRFGMLPDALLDPEIPKRARRAYGILTEGALLPQEDLYASGRLATYVCRFLSCDGWVYPPNKLGASTHAEYLQRRRLNGTHFHDEVMLCGRALRKCHVRLLLPDELAKYSKGYPGPDPRCEWIDDSYDITSKKTKRTRG